MEVTKSNYLQVLPEIISKIKTAAFVSFDAEYTGLKSVEGETPSLFDTTADRYEILRRVVLNNSAPQFGIAIFHRIQDSNVTEAVYSVDAYTFYLLEPSFAGFNMSRTKASVEMDCCQFLNCIKFDFFKWLVESTPYLNSNMVQELKEYLDANPDFMKQCKDEDLPLDEDYFPEYIPHLTETDKEDVVRRLRGFSVIADVISSEEIPVIGHNMALDVMYFFNNFCANLPETYADFKDQVVKYLPHIYDTKYMTVKCRKMLDHPALSHCKDDMDQLKCSGLYVIYKTSSKVVDKFSPKFILLDSCQHFEEDLELGKVEDLEEGDQCKETLCHQPSFDACVTGMVFLYLAHIASRISKELLNGSKAPSMEDILFNVNQWRDQIFVSRATVMTMCLKGDDPRPNRSWVKVTYPMEENFTGEQVMRLLKTDPGMAPLLIGVDYKSISSNQIFLAVARAQSAQDLTQKLQERGFLAERIMIPWDKKRFDAAKDCVKDAVYDTSRNTFLY